MKIFLIFNLLLLSFDAIAQKATYSNNAVTYLGKTYKVGDIIQLGYGSANDKDFVFVNFGKAIGNVPIPRMFKKADVNWSKAEVEIVKVYTTNGVIWARCNPLNRDANFLNKQIFINIEGALDNNEILGVNSSQNISAGSSKNTQSSKTEQKTSAQAPPPSENEITAAPSPPTATTIKSKIPAKKPIKK